MDTFAPPRPPSYDGNGVTETPRMISVPFGDGYKMTAPDGLNPNDATAAFSWAYVTEAEAAQIMEFYLSHIGQTFLWAAPGDLIGTGKWRFTNAKTQVVGFDWYSANITLERSFERG